MNYWENMNKIISYFGFAKKSNNCVMGQTALKKSTKKMCLIAVCGTASDNLKDMARNIATKHACPYIITKALLSDLLHENDIKIVGITDENLSKAIMDNKEKISIG